MSKNPCFRVKVLTDFSSAHALRGYVGDCARIHGHNWKVEAELDCSSLDNIGISVDFKNVRSLLKEIISPYDHQLLNELPPFDKINPTAENIAAFFYKQLEEALKGDMNVSVRAITIWETDRSSIRYFEND